MSNFAIYMIGVLVVVAALGYGAFALSVPPIWIGVGVAVIFGWGLMAGVKKTRTPSRRR